MRKKRKPLTPEQKANRKKIFKLFGSLVIGAVKIWLNGNKYIVLADQVDEFINEYPTSLDHVEIQ
jgi:hypothetical protein